MVTRTEVNEMMIKFIEVMRVDIKWKVTFNSEIGFLAKMVIDENGDTSVAFNLNKELIENVSEIEMENILFLYLQIARDPKEEYLWNFFLMMKRYNYKLVKAEKEVDSRFENVIGFDRFKLVS